MFYYLEGTLTVAQSALAVIDCGGVGYQLTVSLNTASSLSSKIGKKARLYTYLAVREDGVELFGFGDLEEKDAFMRLTAISGVGPKAAMSILSTLTPAGLAAAVQTEDAKAISRANGIGGKIAARIILELHGKLSFSGSDDSATQGSEIPAAHGNLSEAAEALAVLGYDRSTVMNALKGIDPTQDVGTIVKLALKKLAR